MKHVFTAIIFFFTIGAAAQTQYEVIPDGNDKILKGIISRELLSKDTAYKWYKQNSLGYVPYADALKALKDHSANIQFIVFGGTWCSDTRYILPKFFSLIDAAGVTPERITLIGVDRNKKTISHLAEALGIINVPTIIIMKEGKELGRVVEYGKTGLWDKELGEIINTAK